MFRPAFISVCFAACFVLGYAEDVYAESYVDKGKKYYEAGDYRNAMNCFQARIKKKPKDPFANYYAALTFQATGDFQKAYNHFKIAARYAGKNNITKYSVEAMKSLKPRLKKSATSSSRKKPASAKELKESFLSNIEERKNQMEKFKKQQDKSNEGKEQ